MPWDDDEAMLADAVIDAFGVAVEYLRDTPGAYDPATGIRAPAATDSTPISAVRGRSRTDLAGDAKRRVELVAWTIRAADLSADPRPGDRIAREGLVYTITAVERSLDANAWELRTRRSID